MEEGVAVGIDVAKDFHWVQAIDRRDSEVLFSGRVDNTPPALAALVERLEGLRDRGRLTVGIDAAFTPGTTWPVIGHPPGSSRENSQTPRFRCHLDFANDASIAHAHPGTPGPDAFWNVFLVPPDASSAPSPRSLTTTVFSQRSMGWFSAFPRRTTLEGQQASISSTAPPMNDVSYTTPPSAFVTHGCRTSPRLRASKH